jgi:hypothetical protein
MTEEEYKAEHWALGAYNQERECKVVQTLIDACHAVDAKPHVPRLHCLLKALDLPSIPRQRLKDILTDYLR